MASKTYEVAVRLRWVMRQILKPENREHLSPAQQDELEEKLAELESRLAWRKRQKA